MWKFIFLISALIFIRSSSAENQTKPAPEARATEDETSSLGSRINQGVYLVYKHILDDERVEVSEFLDTAVKKVFNLDEQYTKMFASLRLAILKALEKFQFVDNNLFNVDTKFTSYQGRTQNEFGILQRKIKNVYTRIQAEYIAATNDVIDIMVQDPDHIKATKCWKKDKKNVTKSFSRSWDIIKSTVNDEIALMEKEVERYSYYVRSKVNVIIKELEGCDDDNCANEVVSLFFLRFHYQNHYLQIKFSTVPPE